MEDWWGIVFGWGLKPNGFGLLISLRLLGGISSVRKLLTDLGGLQSATSNFVTLTANERQLD
jgi:hypothetical protein